MRYHLIMPYPIQLLISCHHLYSQKKKRNLFLKKVVKTWLVPVDVSIVEAVRGVSVLLPSSCRHRVPCVQTHVPTPPLFSSLLFFVVVYGAVLTGTAIFFFFFTTCYTSTGHNQNCYRKSISCASYSWTPGCKLPKGGHTYLVNKYLFARIR